MFLVCAAGGRDFITERKTIGRVGQMGWTDHKTAHIMSLFGNVFANKKPWESPDYQEREGKARTQRSPCHCRKVTFPELSLKAFSVRLQRQLTSPGLGVLLGQAFVPFSTF